ncbi:MAG: cation diffusion facilitator family transporter, partial [Acholeplasmataceae bacterium]|nr:cation diffusion facilitator family transporter [Acholeplasmataceae bacterium]
MYKWFVNWFIKNKDTHESAEKRAKIGSLAGTFGIISNTALSVLKMIVGLLSGSVSILAEGIDNLTDGASSLVTIMGFRWSQAPADEEHPFGHQRIEYITGLLISVVVLMVALFMGYRSVLRIINPVGLEVSYWTLLLLGLTILVKLYQGGFYRYLARLINSETLVATATDSFNDSIRTAAVIIGTAVYLLTKEKVNLDGY